MDSHISDLTNKSTFAQGKTLASIFTKGYGTNIYINARYIYIIKLYIYINAREIYKIMKLNISNNYIERYFNNIKF